MIKVPFHSSLRAWIDLNGADVRHLIANLIKPDRVSDESKDHLSGARVAPISSFEGFDRGVKHGDDAQAPSQAAGLTSRQYVESTQQGLGQRHVYICQCSSCGQAALLSVEKVVDTKLSGQTMPSTGIARYAKKLAIQSRQENGALSIPLDFRRFCRSRSKVICFRPQPPHRKSSKERYPNPHPCDQQCARSHRNAHDSGCCGVRFPPHFTSRAQRRTLNNAVENTHSLIPPWTALYSATGSNREVLGHG
ncbi:hypothetical protein ABH900_003607 [Stenotrophomonas sp. AN71]